MQFLEYRLFDLDSNFTSKVVPMVPLDNGSTLVQIDQAPSHYLNQIVEIPCRHIASLGKNIFIHIFQGYFTGTEEIIQLHQYQLSNTAGYGSAVKLP